MSATAVRTVLATPAEPETVAELATLQQRLRAGGRLLGLLADQLDAAAGEGTERLPWLAAERQVLERELRAEVEPAEGEEPEIAAEVGRLLEQAIGTLEGRTEEEQRLRDWIDALQDASLPLLRRMAIRPRRMGRYGGAAPHAARVNVRF